MKQNLMIVAMIIFVGVVPQSTSQMAEIEPDRNMEDLISELSKTRQLLEKISNENIDLFWMSLGIGIISTVSLVAFTILYLRRQLKNTEQEMERKLRPILSKTIIEHWGDCYKIIPSLENYKETKEDKSSSKQHKFVLAIKNVGTVAATNITKETRHIVLTKDQILELKPEDDEGMKNEDRENEIEETFKDRIYQKFDKHERTSLTSKVASLQPDEIHFVDIEVDEKEWNDITRSDGFYFEIILKYRKILDNVRKNIYRYSIIGHFVNGVLLIRTTDIELPDDQQFLQTTTI